MQNIICNNEREVKEGQGSKEDIEQIERLVILVNVVIESPVGLT